MNLTSDLYIVGIGPGNLKQLSREAYAILQEVEVIVGYQRYLDLITELISNQQLYSSGMRAEKDRLQKAISFARSGKKTAIISSGDAGVYGMAGPVLEYINQQKLELKVEVIPGITAANAAAALLGAPLMHDYAVISLSDILTSWTLIKKRLQAAAGADLITVLYNPRSSRRQSQLVTAQKIFLKVRSEKTPVGIVRNAGRQQQEIIITNLQEIPVQKVDMLTTVIIGNSQTYCQNDQLVTPRGYQL
ncbi:precorrin-3B C(17)-methyltransferase [Halanaerobium salsuginis]|jgi:precorrin-3B C17-methyltransferase|uniref:Cobalt-precorrin 3 C17-methyltransferase n=1 Tax=Halanaerobium salsuginis TaxID=29563 RepID=A0A1I4K4M7_9FIRM|nr:precorrin-3B C(17)-methyltransferase [Halanaerobium salsuginis]SFL73705.1 cobalt-precorrin 3 C17-methyltransferase [Halanaerobium salsuginis]